MAHFRPIFGSFGVFVRRAKMHTVTESDDWNGAGAPLLSVHARRLHVQGLLPEHHLLLGPRSRCLD